MNSIFPLRRIIEIRFVTVDIKALNLTIFVGYDTPFRITYSLNSHCSFYLLVYTHTLTTFVKCTSLLKQAFAISRFRHFITNGKHVQIIIWSAVVLWSPPH